MPSAFENYDPKPYAPGSGGKTPLELARADDMIGRWLICGDPAPGPCHTDGRRRKLLVADIAPHRYEPTSDAVCQYCPLPPGHRTHRTRPVDQVDHDTELRMLGEREEQHA